MNGPDTQKYISHFSGHIEAFLNYREALGFSRVSYESALQNFDRYAAINHTGCEILNREIVTGWIGQQLDKSRGGAIKKATAIRQFGRYLKAVGKESYIHPEEYITKPPNTFTPYLFTDDELTRLFRAIDSLPKSESNPLASKIPPVLFRLIYTCGLRPNEARELPRKNINLKTGEIFLEKTKRKKERIVVMSGDMLVLCRKYIDVLDSLCVESEYLFPSQDRQPHSSQLIERMLKKCWNDANPNIAADKLPNIRVYDLRHRFASAVLCNWLDEKQNLYNKLAYLQAYMGHEKISETVYYIHILPENLVKSAGIDWDAFESLIPDVEPGVVLKCR
jgi:site-specific recombinase XerD